MQTLYDLAQTILQILSSPAWSGISSLCGLIGIPLAIHLARRPQTPQRQLPAHNFKNFSSVHNTNSYIQKMNY